jgi:hypothetical protein
MLERSQASGEKYILSSFYTLKESEAREQCVLLEAALIKCSVTTALIPATQ